MIDYQPTYVVRRDFIFYSLVRSAHVNVGGEMVCIKRDYKPLLFLTRRGLGKTIKEWMRND
jgi:hypothetical protein